MDASIESSSVDVTARQQLIVEPANPFDIRPTHLKSLIDELEALTESEVVVGWQEVVGAQVMLPEVLTIWIAIKTGDWAWDKGLDKIQDVTLTWFRRRSKQSNSSQREQVIEILGPDGEPLRSVTITPQGAVRDTPRKGDGEPRVSREKPPIRWRPRSEPPPSLDE